MILKSIINYLSIQQSETFRLVSDTNVITNIIIKEKCTLEEIQLVVTLCPRLEHLTIRVPIDFFELTLQLLLSNTNENTLHLFSLCITDVSQSLVEILEMFIKSEELLDDYSLKFIDNKLYLWW